MCVSVCLILLLSQPRGSADRVNIFGKTLAEVWKRANALSMWTVKLELRSLIFFFFFLSAEKLLCHRRAQNTHPESQDGGPFVSVKLLAQRKCQKSFGLPN